MSKTTKSTLIKELEKSSVLNNSEIVDVVIDGEIFFLHLIFDLPEIFEFSRSILRKLCSSFSTKRVEISFGKVVATSIKFLDEEIISKGR